jgi:hypothetical protein
LPLVIRYSVSQWSLVRLPSVLAHILTHQPSPKINNHQKLLVANFAGEFFCENDVHFNRGRFPWSRPVG